MLTNYIRIFIQHLKRNPIFSFINILGLGLGLGVSYIIALYTFDELSYDRFHSDYNRIYRVGIQGVLSGNEFIGINSCAPISAALKSEVPGIQESIRLAQQASLIIHSDNNPITENNVLLADSNFFDFFSFELIAGDQKTALSGKNKIVLTEASAKKYFGDAPYSEIVGEFLTVGTEKESYEITGVAEDAPRRSHIQYPMILSMATWDWSFNTQWTSNSLYTYFKMFENADINQIPVQFDALVEKYVGPEIEQYIGITLDEFRQGGGDYGYWTQPLGDIHLRSHFDGELEANGDIQNVIIFSIVGIFVLVIAGINFISLSTARATDRAKEVGIRKTFGAYKKQLIFQYLFESLGYCLIAGSIALIGIGLSLDYFNEITNKEFQLTDLVSSSNISLFFLFIFLISFLSGIYPSLVLSSFAPTAIFRGRITSRISGRINVRNLMVGFQFVLTTIAIVLTITVYKQLDLMRNKNLGFQGDQVLTVFNAHHVSSKVGFKQELLSIPEIEYVNLTQGFPPFIFNNSVHRVSDTQEDHLFYMYRTDPDHFNTFQIELLQGRLFEDARLDSNSIIMNETAFKMTGWSDIDGKQIEGYSDDGVTPSFNVVGVVKDFHFQDFKSTIQPLLIYCAEDWGRFTAIKVNSENMTSTISKIEDIWNSQTNGKTFDYSFVDTQFDKLFQSEKRLGELTSILAVMTILTASMGLFGLAMYVARKRRKEFSIRKVLGASVTKVMAIQIRYFLTISLISVVISIPVSFTIVNRWLEEFQYRIPNDWTIYTITILTLIVFIILTVSYQSYRASTHSPTKVLRENN